jgi:hypothetical protein
MQRQTFDAIVVGSGISGGWAAKELTEKGLRTLVLEAGGPIDPAADYTMHIQPWELHLRGYRDRDKQERGRLERELQAAALLLVAVGAVYVFQRTPSLRESARHEARAPAPPTAPRVSEAPVPPKNAVAPGVELRPRETIAEPAPPPPPHGSSESRTEKAREEKATAAPRVAPPRVLETPGDVGETGRGARYAFRSTAEGQRAVGSRVAPETTRLSGRLIVENEEEAAREVATLAARVGGTEVSRRASGDALVVEIELPGTAWVELARALSRIGFHPHQYGQLFRA